MIESSRQFLQESCKKLVVIKQFLQDSWKMPARILYCLARSCKASCEILARSADFQVQGSNIFPVIFLFVPCASKERTGIQMKTSEIMSVN